MDVSEEDEDHEDHEDLEEDRLPDLIREDEGPEPRECWVGFREIHFFIRNFLSVNLEQKRILSKCLSLIHGVIDKLSTITNHQNDMRHIHMCNIEIILHFSL